jgi:hypothetical protein
LNTWWITIEDLAQPINIERIGDYNDTMVPKDAMKGCGFVPVV